MARRVALPHRGHAAHRRRTRGELERAVARDLDAALARRNRVLAACLALLAVVAALALVLRRSITRPLAEVSGSARALSGGDLSADVEYVGRDEIGDVAEAFRDLHVTSSGWPPRSAR